MALPRVVLPKLILKPVGRAIKDLGMIKEGDKILLAVSGGKDSLSLFHLLRHFQGHAPIHFDLGVVTIVPQVEGFELQALTSFFKKFATPYFLKNSPFLNKPKKV